MASIAVLSGGGEAGARLRAHDWSRTPLGPIAAWPSSLSVTVGVVLRSAAPMLLLLGEAGVIVHNDACAAFAGWGEAPRLGQPARVGWPELADWLQEALRLALAGETLSRPDAELALGRAEGPVWADLDAAPVADEDGRPVGVLVILRETTARVRAERAAAEERDRGRRVLDGMTEGFVMLDSSLRVLDMNAEALRLEGRPRDAVVGRLHEEAYPDAAPEVVASYRQALATGRDVALQHRHVWPDGRDSWIDMRAYPTRDGLAVFYRDVTDRKRVEEERDRSAELLAAFLQAVPGVVYAKDRAGRMLVGNRGTAELIGRPPSAFLGKTDAEFLADPEQGAAIMATDRRIMQSGRAERLEETVSLPDGQPAVWLSTKEPMRDGTGAVVGLIGSSVDITDQVKAREVLARSREELEQAVAERTADLERAQEALRQSQKMEAVGQLTGGIAHDFNNLLTGITGSLEIMQARVAQGRIGELDRYLGAAHGAAKRAAALTHRLLAFSRRQTLDPKPVNVNRLVGDMEELIRRTVGPTIHLEVVGAVGLWSTLVDPNQLENALLNLCINARDAMPSGGRITIETANRWLDDRAARERDMPPGQYISLCVSDTGMGMTPEVMSRAFDPFFTTKPIGLGTGLGLSMIYGFVRQSGGQARIYTEEGRGTTLCLYLPRHLGEAEDADAPADATLAAQAHAGETVLVVDDEPTVRMLIAEVLEEAGYAVIEAEDGEAGLKALQSGARVDLLVTDVGLPGGMNGRQVADAARVLRPNLKVLFVTGYAENAAVGAGHLDAGMSVLTKPFAMDALNAKIREMMGAGD